MCSNLSALPDLPRPDIVEITVVLEAPTRAPQTLELRERHQREHHPKPNSITVGVFAGFIT
jgi:hypothetical protein